MKRVRDQVVSPNRLSYCWDVNRTTKTKATTRSRDVPNRISYCSDVNKTTTTTTRSRGAPNRISE